ncbi:phage portal protein [Enterococcus dongliensis]|uniref:Phage portal protein n=1 Tax=Enterococcus dongliensis TaxID=2559925 RepID=A0AAW8TIH4_9ENTE|nr:phage portal protein [Enterococcus dongliensis]MDT2635688.1 phage portal protein [Enterococcus dongliensis]MDT2637656.1 phage portal protein [Enterococcus dongliensis]MDT2642724.1 phage portal protein [Enterococcus dongliensis]
MDKVNEFEHGIDSSTKDGVNINYVTFPIESNLHYRFSSAEDLLKDLPTLAAMIRHHYDNQVPRLEVLDDYYKAKNTNIIKNSRRKEKEKSDHRSAHNFGKVLCTFDVGYNTGNPVKVQIDDNAKQSSIDEFNTNNDIDGLNAELWLDMDKYGRAYEIMYRDSDDLDYVDLANVFETFVVYDTTVKREPIAAVRYPKTRFMSEVDKQKIQPTVYTKDKIVTFEETTLVAVELKNPAEEYHDRKEVPITEYSPNRFRMGLYEDILSLIDLYDAGQSDTANYMTDLNDALLVISGDIEASGITTEEAIKQKDANMLLLESGIDINGNKTSVTAGYIYKQYDVNGVEAYKDRVRKDIHEISMVPDLTDNNFSGVQSGESMKYKLFGFEQMTATKQRLFKKGLMRRYRLLFNLKTSVAEVDNADLKGFRVTFAPNLPKAVLEELKALVDSGAELSQETILGLSSFVTDVPAEIERVKSEQPVIEVPDYFEGGNDNGTKPTEKANGNERE